MIPILVKENAKNIKLNMDYLASVQNNTEELKRHFREERRTSNSTVIQIQTWSVRRSRICHWLYYLITFLTLFYFFLFIVDQSVWTKADRAVNAKTAYKSRVKYAVDAELGGTAEERFLGLKAKQDTLPIKFEPGRVAILASAENAADHETSAAMIMGKRGLNMRRWKREGGKYTTYAQTLHNFLTHDMKLELDPRTPVETGVNSDRNLKIYTHPTKLG